MPDSDVHEVVWISHRSGDHCGMCGTEITSGAFVQINQRDGNRCVTCAGYADLCYLPAGDPVLTRTASSLSSRVVVVVKFSRARKRHERQGILVDEGAFETAVQRAPQSGRFEVIDIDGGTWLRKQPRRQSRSRR
jgi:hypothetical protein